MALAYDTSSQSSGVGTSLTWAHTCTGPNRILFVGTNEGANVTQVITGVTYAGVAMTKIRTDSTSNNYHGSLWYLIAPATGANNIVITASASRDLVGFGVSYTGASQTAQPDASNGGTFSASTITQAVTTVSDLTWLVGFWVGNRAPLAGASTTIRETLGANAIVDSNGINTPPGSYSLQITQSDTTTSAFTVVSIVPTLPPEVTTQAVTSIDYTTATGNGTVVTDNGLTISERGVCWNTSTNPTTANSKATSAGTTGAFTVAMTGLTQSTHYYARAYAINVSGTAYGAVVEFDTLTPPIGVISKDIGAAQGSEYHVSINVGGTLGSVTVSLGSTGTSQVINAGAGVTTFSGIYSGVIGLIITKSATFNGYVDDVMYVLQVGTGTVDWTLSTFTVEFAIASSVLFKRIEDKDFNKSRIYRYLDLIFKDLDSYATVTIRQEQSDVSSDKTKTFLVGGVSGTVTSPFIKKRISFLSKNQAILIGVSNANKNDAFTLAKFALKGIEQPKKLFSSSKIISIT